MEHYTEYIHKNPEWEFAGIFADDGITGTNTKKRTEFNRMIDECMAGNIDMIITKSISRFARNILDCLKYIRQLKEQNIPVYFEKESINTMDAKGEVLITIMASLAQQESQSLSQNVKLGLQFRYQNVATVIRASATASADAIDEKLLELQQELLKKANSKEAYDEIADEIFRLRELKQQTTVDTVTRDEQIKRITALQDFIRSQPAELTEFDEALVRRWFKRITVYEDHYTVELKSGLSVDIDAE